MAIVQAQKASKAQIANTPIVNTAFGAAPANLSVLVAFLSINTGGADTVTPPAGWVLDGSIAHANGVTLKAYHKVCGASEPTTYSFSDSGGQLDCLSIAEYTGVDNATPLDVSASTNSQNATTAPVLTGVSDVTPNSMLVGGITGVGGATITKPASMTLIHALSSATPNEMTTAEELSDTTGNRTGTFSSADDGVTILIRLRPSGAAVVSVGFVPRRMPMGV